MQLWTWVSIFCCSYKNFKLKFLFSSANVVAMSSVLHRMKPVVLHAKIMVCNHQLDIQDFAPPTDQQLQLATIRKVISSVRIRTHSKRKHLIRQHIKYKTPSKMHSSNHTKRLYNQWQTVYRMDFRSAKMSLTDSKML